MMKKRLLSSLLSLCMLLSLLPGSALAAATETGKPVTTAEVLPDVARGLGSVSDLSTLHLVQTGEWQPSGSFSDGVYEAYYAQLDDTSKALYIDLKNKLTQPGTTELTYSFSEAKTADGFEAWRCQDFYPAYEALTRDHPERPWLNCGSFGFTYTSTGDGTMISATTVQFKNIPPEVNTADCITAFHTAVAAAKAEIDKKITSPGDPYATLKAIHDYLCELIAYESDSYADLPFDQTAYSGLVSPNKTVCAGYTASFKLLCDKYGIPCIYVSGDAGEPHAWNFVLLQDKWYAVDVTWDDQTAPNSTNLIYYDFFLAGSETVASSFWSYADGMSYCDSHVADNLCVGNQISLPWPALSQTAYRITPYDKKSFYSMATYGQTLRDIEPPVTILAVVGDDDVAVDGTYIWKDPALSVGNVTASGTYNKFPAIFIPEEPDQFNSIEVIKALKVAPAPLTIIDAVVTPKCVGDNTAAVVTGVTFRGLIGKDALVLGTDYTVSGEYASTNAEGEVTVTVTVHLNETSAAKNYTLDSTTFSAAGLVNNPPASPSGSSSDSSTSSSDSSNNPSSSSSGNSNSNSSSSLSANVSAPVSTGSAQTTAVPSVTVRGGTASAVVTSATGQEIVKQATKNASGTVVIAPSIRDSIASAQVTIPSSTVGGLGSRTDANVVVDTPVAQVTIPNSALSGLSSGGDLTISAQRRDSTLSVTLQAGSQTVYRVADGLTVTVPISPDAAPGTVAMLVNRDGSRQVIRKSVAVDGTVTIPLDGTATVELTDNSKRFLDVLPSSWAYDAISFVSSHELFNGTSADIFSPDASMTRGMLAMVLHNLENNPSSFHGSGFPDVAGGIWYADAVSWAVEQGIVSGYPDGTFGAEDNITREQLAVMLYRHASSPRTVSGQASRFSDSASISGYAQTALDWAVENGIMSGMGNNLLDPQGLATRAQVAQLLKNYLESDQFLNQNHTS